jgi:hypothetical protein
MNYVCLQENSLHVNGIATNSWTKMPDPIGKERTNSTSSNTVSMPSHFL